MKKKLVSLPDAKLFHKVLTIGKEYEIKSVFGNGFVIDTDDGAPIIILQERLE